MAQRQLPRGNAPEERDEVVIDGDFSDINGANYIEYGLTAISVTSPIWKPTLTNK